MVWDINPGASPLGFQSWLATCFATCPPASYLTLLLIPFPKTMKMITVTVAAFWSGLNELTQTSSAPHSAWHITRAFYVLLLLLLLLASLLSPSFRICVPIVNNGPFRGARNSRPSSLHLCVWKHLLRGYNIFFSDLMDFVATHSLPFGFLSPARCVIKVFLFLLVLFFLFFFFLPGQPCQALPSLFPSRDY